MIILTHLKATPAAGEIQEPRGILTTLYDEPVPGFIRHVKLGSAGLVIRTGLATVAIPLPELLRLAEEADPALAPPRRVEVPEPPPATQAATQEER